MAAKAQRVQGLAFRGSGFSPAAGLKVYPPQEGGQFNSVKNLTPKTVHFLTGSTGLTG